MEINWFTVIAQVINFFILVWLLKRFLYKPVLKAIAKRESKIEAQIKDAEENKAIAVKEQDEFKQKNMDFESDKNSRMNAVASEVKLEKEKLLAEARADAESFSKHLTASLKEQQLNEQLEQAQKIKEEVLSLVRKVLNDLADVTLEQQVIQAFIKRLNGLENVALKKFKKAFQESEVSLQIKSAQMLSNNQENEIKSAINDVLNTEVKLKFLVIPELISGIELNTKDYKIAWNISAFVNDFEKATVASNKA